MTNTKERLRYRIDDALKFFLVFAVFIAALVLFSDALERIEELEAEVARLRVENADLRERVRRWEPAPINVDVGSIILD